MPSQYEMSPPVDGCLKYPFPHRSFRTPVKKRLTWKLRPAFESVSLFIYCEPNIVDRAFAIDLFKSYVEIGLFPISERGKYKL